MTALTAALHHHDAVGLLSVLLVLVAVLAIFGGLYRLWLRDFVGGAVLLIAGLVVLLLAA